MRSSALMSEMRINASSIAKTRPVAIETLASFNSSGTPTAMRCSDSHMKAKSMALSPPQAAARMSLGAFEQPVGERGQRQIEHRRGDIEVERQARGSRTHLRLAQQLDQAGDGNQRRFLEDELPAIAQAGDRVPHHLWRHDPAQQQGAG